MSVNGSKMQPAIHVSLTHLRTMERFLNLKSEQVKKSKPRQPVSQTNGSLETGFVSGIAPEPGMQTEVRHALSQLPRNPQATAGEVERTSQCPDCRATPLPWEAETWHYGSGS